ncbi:MAG: type II toxin-antitoxin system Phd/YefM family antitoxin [Jatrophihabitans sp.]
MVWQVQEAKQRFSELLRRAGSDGPQIVTKHGEEVAVVINFAEYRKLSGHTYGSFNAALLDMPKVESPDVFERRREGPARATPQLDWV